MTLTDFYRTRSIGSGRISTKIDNSRERYYFNTAWYFDILSIWTKHYMQRRSYLCFNDKYIKYIKNTSTVLTAKHNHLNS